MFFDELQEIYKKNDINITRKFLEDSLEKAIKNNDLPLMLEVLNELIGFLRDISLFADSAKYANSLSNIIEKISIDPNSKFICYINIANSYRAFGKYDISKDYFEKAIFLYNNSNLNDSKNLAALYNNYSLLYEEIDLNEALRLLYIAKEIISKENEDIKLASTDVNIAFVLIKLNRLNDAKNHLNEAGKIFDINPCDFHASGYYNAMGKYFYLTNNYKESIYYYEKALKNLKRTVGKNLQYQDTLKELFNVYKTSKIHFKGLLDKSEEYYRMNIKNVFNGINNTNKICIGLFGPGSECYGADDCISMDHDYEVGFVVVCDDDIDEDVFDKLVLNYNLLEKEYEDEIIVKLDKHGVFHYSDYVNNYLYNNNSLITNGKIFFNKKSQFYDLRNKIINKIKYDRLPNIANKTLEINQIINYNIERLRIREDYSSIEILNNHLVDRLIEYGYILDNKAIPHEKLQLKLLNDKNIKDFIKKLIDGNLDYQELTNYLIDNLEKNNIIYEKNSSFIEDYKKQMLVFISKYNFKIEKIKSIIEIEWDMIQMLKNIGGRASCQDNYDYFVLMRKSQFFAWDNELIDSYLNDLNEANRYGYNLLAIKYGFMEESIDKVHFEKIKDNLPKLSQKRISLQEAIISLQLEMLEDFSKIDEIKARNMRSFYSSYDTISDVSYETYLRGELSSYSENTVFLYGRMLSDYSKKYGNYVKAVINYTDIFK